MSETHALTPEEAKAILRWLRSGGAVTATPQQAAHYRAGRDKLEAIVARNREEKRDG